MAKFPGRIDETPVRNLTDTTGRRSVTPGTPPGVGGAVVPPRILPPREVQLARLGARFRRFLQTQVDAPDGYVSDIVAAMILNTVGMEDLYPDELSFDVQGTALQNAGNRSSTTFRNPALSTNVACIDAGWITASRLNTAGLLFVLVRPATAPNANTTVASPRDTRLQVSTGFVAGNVIHGQQDNVGGVPGGLGSYMAAFIFSGAANGVVGVVPFPLVVFPGWEIVIFPDIDNEGIRTNVGYRQRPLAEFK